MLKKPTIRDAQTLAEKKNGKCLSIEYINNHTKMLWECEEEHQWEAVYNNIQQDHWCPECRKITLQDAQKLAEKKNGNCLSEEYINNCTKMLWECEKEHQWEATYSNIRLGGWCPYCAGVAKNTLQNAQTLAEKHNGNCLSKEYINNCTKMLWECENKHQWKTAYTNIQRGCWCPCCRINKTQKKLAKILQELIKEDSITIRPQWLKNPETNYPLEIDIYFPKHKIAVEYNGEQHYKSVDFAGRGKEWAEKNLRNIQKRDKLKQKLIKQNPDKVKHFIIFTHKNVIEEENVKSILVKRDVI